MKSKRLPVPKLLSSFACSFSFPAILFTFFLAFILTACKESAKPEGKNGPLVVDERLVLSLFAEDPDIVTPIGIAVDSLERIFVLESHTHTPPKDYAGPDSDRIKIFIDDDRDGRPDKISVFAEGFQEGVNLAFSPEGILHLITSRAVYALYDRDGDGVSEERKKLIALVEPEKVYAHAAFLGITFSTDGWLYFSRGNTGGAAWKVTGSDSSTVSGYGDGGNIMKARFDGSNLQEVATGFWNPADLKFDSYGRLLAADNDPDSRGPNRLVHVVAGGDYGYQTLYGGSGIHPYLSWNGELPGTLPYAVALGEAPSGLIDANITSLPADYRGQLLASIWEESRIVRVDLLPKGVSVTGTAKVIVEGGPEFRPVAFAAGLTGDIYFTDWVLRNYPNHGRGRVWKLSAGNNADLIKPRQLYAPPLRDSAVAPLPMLLVNSVQENMERLTIALQSNDPFVQHAAVIALSSPTYHSQLNSMLRHTEAKVRTGAMLALQRSGKNVSPLVFERLLSDPDPRIRQRALIWAGKEGVTTVEPLLHKALTNDPMDAVIFETYLETVRQLQPAFIDAFRNRRKAYAKSIERPLPEGFLERFIRDHRNPASLRALAIRHLNTDSTLVPLITSLLSNEEAEPLRLEAVHALLRSGGPGVSSKLLNILEDEHNSAALRAEALLTLSWVPENLSAEVIPFLTDPEPDVQLEAVRYLRARLSPSAVREALNDERFLLTAQTIPIIKEQVDLALHEAEGKNPPGRPASRDEWQEALAKGGESGRGRRVFYSPQSACSSCHAINGRGGDLGPDLSKISLSKSRSQLVSSILFPSSEVTPEYQGWYVTLASGERHQGRQIDIGESTIELYIPSAGFVLFQKSQVTDYGLIEDSLMPEGLESRLTVTDLRDLLTFLETTGRK